MPRDPHHRGEAAAALQQRGPDPARGYVICTVVVPYRYFRTGAGAGFEICIEPEPENPGSGNAGFCKYR